MARPRGTILTVPESVLKAVLADASAQRLLIDRGFSDAAIARAFEVTPGAVWHFRRKHAGRSVAVAA